MSAVLASMVLVVVTLVWSVARALSRSGAEAVVTRLGLCMIFDRTEPRAASTRAGSECVVGLSVGAIARSWLFLGSMSPDWEIGSVLVSSSLPVARALASDTLRSRAFWRWVFPAFIPADFAVYVLNLVICLHLW